MINTIFYFTDTELEYLDTYAYGQVKPHTICFARDTKSIWRDGLRFSGLRKDEVDLIIDEDVKPLIDALEDALNLANQLAIDRDNQLTEDLHDLENTVAVVDGRITTEKNRLDAEISRIDGDIADTNQRLLVEHLALIDTANDIQGKLDRGEVAYNSGWNENVKAYMQTVGLWDYGEDSSIVTKWSQLRQSVDNVSSEVNRVETKADGYNTTLNSKINQTAENITSEVNRVETKADGYNTALQSKINQEITDRGTAITNLSNTFANSTGDLQDVIEWMYSGLHSGAAQDMSYAEIIAAGKNGASSAISDLRTSIETTSDGKYVAQSSLTSSVDNAISGIVNAAAGTYANTQLFAKIDLNGSNIASLTADVTELDLSIQGIASNPNLTATFLAKTDFNTAKAALEAADTQNSNAIGQVQTQVTRLDGGPEVTNSVAAKVNSAISTFEQKVNNGQACTVLVNKVDATSEDLVALTQYIDPDQAYATIGAKIAASEAGVITLVKDDLATAGILSKNGNNYTSAVYTKTQTDNAINSATAGLMAANDFTSASVVAKVNDAGSGIAINADKIKIDANHQLDLSAQTITVNADDINLVGQTHFESAIGDMIDAKSITISDVDGEIQTILENGSAKFTGDVIIVNNNKIQAGLKGGENIRFWSGGNITDTGSEPTDALLSSATFKVDKNGKLYCSDVDITGKMIGTDGNIGGFNIGDKILSNTAYDASIVIQNAASNPTLIARIGKNAIDEITNKSCSILAESKTSGTFNTALYLNAEGGTYNYAFHGNGNGVLNGVVFGYKTQFKSIPSGSSDALSYIYLRDGATTVITGSHSSGHVVLAVPSIDDVRQCLGLSTSSTTPFAIELTFINLSGYEYVHLGFRGEGSLGEKYPWLMNDNNQYMASRLQIALGDVIKLMLIYAPSSSGIGSYEYRAQLIVRRE